MLHLASSLLNLRSDMDISPTIRPIRPSWDGRWVIAALLLAYFVLLAATMQTTGYYHAWRMLGVPGLKPLFADLRDITSSADSARLGYDPLVKNPENPYQVPLDYPRLWLAGAVFLGIHQTDTVWLGFALAGAFYACLFFFVGRISAWEGAYWGVLLCAPPVMLAVERGNNDLVIFMLLAAGLLALRRSGARPWPAYAMIGLGGLLKLFPIVAFMLAWREKPRRALAILAAAAAVFALYLYATRADLRAINAAVPRALASSYGSRIYFYGVADHYPEDVPSLVWTVLAVLAMGVVAGLARLRLPKPATLRPAETDAMLVGGSIFAATFIVGSNYNYRLVMLLFALPGLLRLAGGGVGPHRLLARAMLLAIATGWLCATCETPSPLFFVKEAANWTVFGGTLFLLAQHVPLPSSLAGRTLPGLALAPRAGDAVPAMTGSLMTGEKNFYPHVE